MKFHNRYKTFAITLALLSWLLSACGTIAPTQVGSTPTPSSSLTPPAPIIPTHTSTPTSQTPTAILLAAMGSDQAYVSNLQAALNDVVTRHGLRWQVRQQLSEDDLAPSLKLVVVVPPAPDLPQLVASAPETQFLAVGIAGLEPAPNLTVISPGGRPDQQGFIAGVIAAMIAPDWRVGAISLSDTTEGRAARTGFLNGAVFFCGICRLVNPHPPVYEYPLYIELPQSATTAEWQEAANNMVGQYVRVVYVFPAAGDEAMLSTLADAGLTIISSGEPPQAVSSAWAVSLTADMLPFIQGQVERLLEGNLTGGRSMAAPIQFSHINPELFTPGKQRLAGEILADLQAGYIDTRVDLTTGENRP